MFSIHAPNKRVVLLMEPPRGVEPLVWQLILIGRGYRAVVRDGNVRVDAPQERSRDLYRFIRKYDDSTV